jgi:hypothetical protein
LWAAIFLAFGLAADAVAFETAMHFTGVAIDGPFQLYDALRRIGAGYRPGVDFQFFHGLGVPYVHYWLYRLLGGGLRGSELARELITTTVYPFVFLLFFRAFVDSWTRALCLAAAALAASFALRLTVLPFALNSMLGLRSTLPVLVPAVLYAARDRRSRAVLGGALLGTATFVSTEQGLAVLLAYLAVASVATARSVTKRRCGAEAAATLGIAIVTLVLWLIAVGGIAGMRGALRYNFRLVPMDQYWFFGVPPNTFIPSWPAAMRMLVRLPTVGLAIFLGVVAAALYVQRLWSEPDGDVGRRHFALAVLAFYGLISCVSLLGVFTGAYAQPCWRAVVIIVLVEAYRLALADDARHARRAWLAVPRTIGLATLALTVWVFVTIRLIPIALGVSLPHIIVDHLAGTARFGIAGIWPETLRDGQAMINAHRAPNGDPPLLWSTYAGWLEARNGIFQPSFDYIIHALGPANREAYVQAFRRSRPALVQTVRPSYTQYEPWIENADWGFYAELLSAYSVAGATPWSFFWTRRPEPLPPPRLAATANIPAGLASIQLPPVPADSGSAATLLEIEIEYDVHNPLRALPIIGASPRYLVSISGAVSRLPLSLDPQMHRARFPLLIRSSQQPTLAFQTFSLLPGASWTPRVLRVFVRPLDAADQPWLTELTAALEQRR